MSGDRLYRAQPINGQYREPVWQADPTDEELADLARRELAGWRIGPYQPPYTTEPHVSSALERANGNGGI